MILAANPRNTEQLRLEEEVREIDETLKRSRDRDRFELISKWAVRVQDFRRHMLEVQPHIVHFSGHGGGETGIVLADKTRKAELLSTDQTETRQVELLSTEQLAGLFKLFAEEGLECVLLNACYSEVQAEAIHEHVPYVIGMSQAIGDQAAIAFAVAFYDALGAGRTVEFAYELGCVELIRLKANEIPVLMKKRDAVFEQPSIDELAVIRHNNNPLAASANFQVPASTFPASELSQRTKQEMATNIDVGGDIEAGDMAQKGRDAAVVEQVMMKNVVAENIKLGNLTQEG